MKNTKIFIPVINGLTGCLGLIYSSAIAPLQIVGTLSLQDHSTSSVALIP